MYIFYKSGYNNKMEKYFCIFGGGGIRGTAYSGAIKALEELKIEITGLAGSSVGAIVAGLLAFGYSYAEIADHFENINFDFFNDLNLKITKDFAISKGDNFYSWIKSKIEEKFYKNKGNFPVKFKDIEKDLIIFASDLTTSKFREFSKYKTPDVEIAHAIRVSVAMPGLYSPINENGECLADGDLLKSVPLFQMTENIYKRKEKFLEFRLENNEGKKKISNTIDYLNAVYDTMSGFATDSIIKKYKDFESYDFIKINLDNVSVAGFMINKEKKKEIAEKGYLSTIKYFREDYLEKKEKFKKFYLYVEASLKKMIYYLKKNKIAEAQMEFLEILSNPDLAYADKRIVSELKDFKIYFCQNIIDKKHFFSTKKELINKKKMLEWVKMLYDKIVSHGKKFIV